MDAVIKVGGSLAETPEDLEALAAELGRIGTKFEVVVVPGGGKIADVVREFDSKFGLHPSLAHKMAILAMDQYGLLLSQLIPSCQTCNSLKDAQKISMAGKVAIFLPSNLLSLGDPFEATWDVTSDSIAAHIAIKLQASKLVLLTNVDGIFSANPKENLNARLQSQITVSKLQKLGARTSVDRFLPKFLSQNPLACYIVNGKHPDRINAILAGQQVICTEILS